MSIFCLGTVFIVPSVVEYNFFFFFFPDTTGYSGPGFNILVYLCGQILLFYVLGLVHIFFLSALAESNVLLTLAFY